MASFTPPDHVLLDCAGWRAFGATDIGYLRTRNEDDLALLPEAAAYVLCDGMGGHAGGSEASALVCEAVRRLFAAPAACAPERRLATVIEAAAKAVGEAAAADPALADMGTTTTLVWLGAGDRRAWTAHVGDSRLYRLTKGGLKQITTDHTVAAEMARAGRLSDAEARASGLWHMLTRVIGGGGGGSGQPDILSFPLAGVKAILLCSDGVSNLVPDRDIETILRDAADPAGACRRLIAAALKGGGSDNASAIVLAPQGA